MIKSNNASVYGIKEDVERYLWISYLLFVLLSSLIGDTIILIASNRYNALKLNVFIVVVIQHMAVCDLLISTVFIIPTLVSMMAGGWVLGKALAYVQKFLEFWVFPVNYMLVAIMTTSKYLIVRHPFRTHCWQKKSAHVVCLLFWVFFAAISLTSLLRRPDLLFDYTSYEFDTDYDIGPGPTTWDKFGRTISYIIGTIPLFVILVTVLTLRYLFEARDAARRGGGSLRWQGILTVVMTGTVFCVSSLPYTAYKILSMLEKSPKVNYSFNEDLLIKFERHAEYLSFLNVMSNFYIYTLTVPSFRRFLRSKIQSTFSPTSSIEEDDGKIDGNGKMTMAESRLSISMSGLSQAYPSPQPKRSFNKKRVWVLFQTIKNFKSVSPAPIQLP